MVGRRRRISIRSTIYPTKSTSRLSCRVAEFPICDRSGAYKADSVFLRRVSVSLGHPFGSRFTVTAVLVACKRSPREYAATTRRGAPVLSRKFFMVSSPRDLTTCVSLPQDSTRAHFVEETPYKRLLLLSAECNSWEIAGQRIDAIEDL